MYCPSWGSLITGSALMENMDEDITPQTKIITFAPTVTPIVTDLSNGDCFKREVNIRTPE